MPIADVKTQAGQIDETIGKELVFTWLTLFGGFTLPRASDYGRDVGSVARRTNEIGIGWRWCQRRTCSGSRSVRWSCFWLAGLAIGCRPRGSVGPKRPLSLSAADGCDDHRRSGGCDVRGRGGRRLVARAACGTNGVVDRAPD